MSDRTLRETAHSDTEASEELALPRPGRPRVQVILGILRRQLLLGAAVAAAAMLAAVLLLTQVTPLYTAQALILVEPRSQQIDDTPREELAYATGNNRVDSQVEVIRSDAVVLRAIEGLDPPPALPAPGLARRVEAFLTRIETTVSDAQRRSRLIEVVRSDLRVRRRGLTYVIEIGYTSPSPDRAAALGNAVAQAYIADQVDAKIEAARNAEAALERRVAEIERDRQAILDAFTELAVETRQAAGPGPPSASVDAIQDQIAALTVRRRTIQDEIETLLPAAGIAAQPGTGLDLDTALARLDAQPRTGADVEAEAAQRIAALRRARDTVAGRIEALQRQRFAALNPDALPPETQRRFERLQADEARDQPCLRGRDPAPATRAHRQRRATRPTRASSRSPCRPTTPAFHRRCWHWRWAATLGLGLGVGLGAMRETYLTGLTDPGEVERLTGLPVVARIPDESPSRSGARPGPRGVAPSLGLRRGGAAMVAGRGRRGLRPGRPRRRGNPTGRHLAPCRRGQVDLEPVARAAPRQVRPQNRPPRPRPSPAVHRVARAPRAQRAGRRPPRVSSMAGNGARREVSCAGTPSRR